MTADATLRQDVLFPTDFSPYANHAFGYALEFCNRRKSTLHIAHVIDTRLFNIGSGHGVWVAESDMKRVREALHEHAERRVNDLAKRARDVDVEVVAHIEHDTPVRGIIKTAEQSGCGMIVTATHGRSGLDHIVFGSVAERIVRESSVPVMCIKHPEHEFVDSENHEVRLRKVLFPTDFSPFSEKTLPIAKAICKEFGATLVLLHVNDFPLVVPEYLPELSTSPVQDMEAYSSEALEKLKNSITDVPVEIELATGHPHTEICKVVDKDDIDLAVISTHGRSGVSHVLLGSVAEKIVRKAHCPVLTVRPDKIGATG